MMDRSRRTFPRHPPPVPVYAPSRLLQFFTSPLPKVAAQSDVNAKEWVHIASASELRFTATGEGAKYELRPLYQIGYERYSVYWQMQASKKG
jgi:hypothetical protein